MKSTPKVARETKVSKKDSVKAEKLSSSKPKKKLVLKTAKSSSKKASTVAIKNKTTVKERMLSKMSKVEALHGSKKTDPVKSKTFKENKSKALAILSPFRLPFDAQIVAKQTARYGGITFVTVGALFALFYAQLIQLPINATSQLSQACSSSDVTCITEQGVNLLERNNDNITEPSGVLQQPTIASTTPPKVPTISRPPAIFTIGATEPYRGILPINLTVAEATSVRISAYFEGSGRNINLGSARQENGAWVYTWNTTNFDNGRYRLKALITNKTGSYEAVHPDRVVIENVVVTEEEEDIEAEEQAISQNNNTLNYEYNFDKTSITLSQEFPDPKVSDNVKIYFVDTTNSQKKFLNESHFYSYLLQANDSGAFTWKVTIKAPNLPSGKYVIRTERFRNNVLIDIGKKEIDYKNSNFNTIEDSGDLVKNETGAVISVRGAQSLSKFADVVVETSDATFAEVYAVNTASVNNIFLGLARKTGTGTWVLNWDTKQIPNSTYQLFARIGGSKGIYETNRITVNIRNERQTTPTITEVEELTTRTEEIKVILNDNVLLKSNLWNSDQGTSTEPLFNDFLLDYQDTLQEEFQRYAAAIRSGNESSIAVANTRLLGLENEYLSVIAGAPNNEELERIFTEYIANARARIEGDVLKIERIVSERTSESMLVDSDRDEVSDFDEIYIYKTNPFSADTSGKGIPDGVAILNGLDPLSTDSNASIVFESPKDIGVIREDILSVQSITAVAQDESTGDVTATVAPAVISGTALPNSFVTIYIFSNPIVVTVKTEADGSWQYRFEKELEDGEHSVYVALTDNSGRIIARSEPFSFIKQAQAYTTIDEALSGSVSNQTDSNDYSFFSSSLIYLVLSFAVVTIGLVLLLLGMFLDKRRKVENMMQEETL